MVQTDAEVEAETEVVDNFLHEQEHDQE